MRSEDLPQVYRGDVLLYTWSGESTGVEIAPIVDNRFPGAVPGVWQRRNRTLATVLDWRDIATNPSRTSTRRSFVRWYKLFVVSEDVAGVGWVHENNVKIMYERVIRM